MEFQTFDELRIYTYRYEKNFSLAKLPPTSTTIKMHSLRGFYVTYIAKHIFDENTQELNPCDYGFYEDGDLLLPKIIHQLYPPEEELPPHCICKNCTKSTCPCKIRNVPCCSFCYCKKKNDCKNK